MDSDNLPLRKNQRNSLVRFSNTLDEVFSEFPRNFNDWLPASFAGHGGFFAPRTDFSETDSDYYLEVELPGVKQRDIELQVKDGVLMVKGERKTGSEKKERGYYRKETYSGSFQRLVTLPDNIKEDKVEANFKDGVLEIRIPKGEVIKSEPKKIEIK